jgi:hypothetical protein
MSFPEMPLATGVDEHGAVVTAPEVVAGIDHVPGRCEVCGNDYDKAMRIVLAGRTHVFDCFECAVHALAPTCAHCGCRILGHGMERGGEMYCCAHCGEARGATELKDRV